MLCYQDAERFIALGGQKGPQVEILMPGVYCILTDSIPVGMAMGDEAGNLGTLLLLNLFRDQMKLRGNAENGNKSFVR